MDWGVDGMAVGTAEVIAMSGRVCALLFVALFLFSVSGIYRAIAGASAIEGAGGVPSLDSLTQRISAARGKAPQRDRETLTYTYGGITGKRVDSRDGADERSDDTYGPLISARGEYHKQAWHQNENGETVIEQPDPGKATTEATTTTVTRVTAPFDAFVIATLNAAGDGTKEYVDPQSYRIVRFEEIRPTETTVTSYDDFRTTGGQTRAWHWTVRDGHPEDDAEYRVIADDVGGPPLSLAIPKSRREFVEFPAGKTSVDLAAREQGDKFIVRVQIGGRGLDMLLDTGAGTMILDDGIARELGLARYGSATNAVNAGRFVTSKAVIPQMSVGELRLHDVVVSTSPHLGADGPDYKVVGLLGFDFIDAVALTVDYQGGRLTATKSDAFVPPSGSSVCAVPVRLGSQVPLADVTIDGALGERFRPDTGASGTMLVFDYFARRHPEAFTAPVSSEGQPHFAGAGGAFSAEPYRVAAATLGNFRLTNFTVYRVSSARSFSGFDDGLVGTALLSLFTLYTDYGNSMLYLVPNATGRAARQ